MSSTTTQPGPATDPLGEEIAREQHVLDSLYGRLDEVRERAQRELASIRRQRVGGNHQNRSERDSFAALHENRIAQLDAVQARLCFGRLDLADGERRYIGRIGLADDNQARLLVDWRAQASRPFYQATAANPGQVVLRRHLVTNGRVVTGVEDDVLDLAALSDAERAHLGGEGALMAALSAQRTGRMGDIVATIQAEQDAVIRADLGGVLVVDGGPGTGKTAVALHRAAYLLYTHRDRLARSGVLVVGPSPVFMRYIERVLPSLGESGVVMATAGALFPGVHATAHDRPDVARIKGDPRMVQAVSTAISDRQRVPDRSVHADLDGVRIELTPQAVRGARDRARRSGKPHNDARVVFAKDLLGHLADQMAAEVGAEFSPEDRAMAISDLRDNIEVRRAINLAWMPITAQDLIDRLLSDPRRLASAAPWLSGEEIRAVTRDRGAPFTVEDVPLLDEAAEQLGEDTAAYEAASRAAAAERDAERAYAKGVLAMTGTRGMVSSDELAARFAESEMVRPVADRAAGDRTWAFGHVVVDEAQELSGMMWRLLGRRNPSRSMTVVGDLAQTRSAAGARSWQHVLGPVVGDRWRQAYLGLSYRTPRRIMAAAGEVLTRAGVDVQIPQSVREVDDPPLVSTLPDPHIQPQQWAAVLGSLASQEWSAVAGGRLAVITPVATADAVYDAVAATGVATVGRGNGAVDQEIAVLSVADVKGLEFDGVLLVEPAAIVAEGARGVNDLYVAMTRPTRRLHVAHAGGLPAGMDGLVAANSPRPG